MVLVVGTPPKFDKAVLALVAFVPPCEIGRVPVKSVIVVGIVGVLLISE